MTSTGEAGNGEIKRPAKASCKACRLSKVKCDLETSATGVCSRCARVRLHCIPNDPSKRGRKSAAATAARLGPALRDLLVDSLPPPNPTPAFKDAGSHSDPSTEASGSTDGVLTVPTYEPPTKRRHVPAADLHAATSCVPTVHLSLSSTRRPPGAQIDLHSSAWTLQRDVLNEMDNKGVKMQWLQGMFLYASRKKSWALTQQALQMAEELRLGIEEAMGVAARAMVQESDALPPRCVLPEYVQEWHTRNIMCVTRCDVDGVVSYLANQAMRDEMASLFGDGGQTCDALCGDDMDPLGSDEDWLNFGASERDKRLAVQAFCRAWALVECDEKGELPMVQHVEYTEEEPVTWLFGSTAVTGIMRIRIVVRNHGRERYECCAIKSDNTVVMCEPSQLMPHAVAGLRSGHGVSASTAITAKPVTTSSLPRNALPDTAGDIEHLIAEAELEQLADTMPLEHLLSDLPDVLIMGEF
mmetsp:Transcript_22293/g.60183  ORF Transcript_22293/g.60183 Transcript_22293/m.60183 type:complete len:470 (-) Transcript_22293:199-1608(-)|eukprot:CAMPEP_0185155788 /NCGR_PEP_ID=MMETSP1139-20130426/666_1 /TAXON_ID=298111 /ORGANISM="Pavlova sp., Strain CCMP459" /LENGTH=469 /DNA_ID=CAMNT_0027720717 /DNA_START=24 /DNA_END=1433 /DNA_ORIENTATION=-